MSRVWWDLGHSPFRQWPRDCPGPAPVCVWGAGGTWSPGGSCTSSGPHPGPSYPLHPIPSSTPTAELGASSVGSQMETHPAPRCLSLPQPRPWLSAAPPSHLQSLPARPSGPLRCTEPQLWPLQSLPFLPPALCQPLCASPSSHSLQTKGPQTDFSPCAVTLSELTFL